MAKIKFSRINTQKRRVWIVKAISVITAFWFIIAFLNHGERMDSMESQETFSYFHENDENNPHKSDDYGLDMPVGLGVLDLPGSGEKQREKPVEKLGKNKNTEFMPKMKEEIEKGIIEKEKKYAFKKYVSEPGSDEKQREKPVERPGENKNTEFMPKMKEEIEKGIIEKEKKYAFKKYVSELISAKGDFPNLDIM